MTRVWPALCPPWNRPTISACSESQSTILPLPSSPHCEPTTTTFAIKSPSKPHASSRRLSRQCQPRQNRRILRDRLAGPNHLGAVWGACARFVNRTRAPLSPLAGKGQRCGMPCGLSGSYHDRLVRRPALAPTLPDLALFAGCRLERPHQHAAAILHIALARGRGGGEQVGVHVGDLADRHLVFDRDRDRRRVAVAHRDLELTLVGLARRDQPGRAFDLLHHPARELHLVVSAEAEPQR